MKGNNMPEKDTPKKGRHKKPLHIMLPADERERLETYAGKVGRPLSWVVRDGLRAYLDTVEADADRLASLRMDPELIGRTEQSRRGRPLNSEKG